MADSRLVLVKHSLPLIDPELPAAQWRLGETGRQRCAALARRLASYAPDQVITSREPKAMETGRLVAEHLAIPWTNADNLHEHERPEPGLVPRDRFEAEIAGFFERPAELVFGAETALQALARFRAAVGQVVRQNPDQTLALVAHGTVITLFVAEMTGCAPFPLWKRLGLPSFVALSLPNFQLETVVEQIT